jgi:hypothetical protein
MEDTPKSQGEVHLFFAAFSPDGKSFIHQVIRFRSLCIAYSTTSQQEGEQEEVKKPNGAVIACNG